MGDAGADAFTLAAIFGWSVIRMAMRYTVRWKMQSAEPWKQSQSEQPEPHVKMQRLKFHVTGA